MATNAWWLDERTHAGAEHLDTVYVAGYERKAGYDPADDVQTLLAAGLRADSTVVDMGAGTGVFALAMAPPVARMIAVDVSPAMLAVLREHTAGAGNIEVVAARWVSYDHAGPPADAEFSRNALHQIPDLWRGVAPVRVAAQLRPGASCACTTSSSSRPPRRRRWRHGSPARRRPDARLDA